MGLAAKSEIVIGPPMNSIFESTSYYTARP